MQRNRNCLSRIRLQHLRWRTYQQIGEDLPRRIGMPTPPRLMRAHALDDPRLVAAARGAVRAGGRWLRELPTHGRGFGYDKNDGQKGGYTQEGFVFGADTSAGLLHWCRCETAPCLENSPGP